MQQKQQRHTLPCSLECSARLHASAHAAASSQASCAPDFEEQPVEGGEDSFLRRAKTMLVSPADRLYQLQRIDSQLTQLAHELATLDDGAALRAQVDRLHADHQAAQAALHAKQSQLSLLELELQSTTTKAHTVERDLYSGRTANPKELTALQEDLQALGRQRQRLEDEILAVMEEIERLLGETKTLDGSTGTARRALDEHLIEFRTRQDAITAQSQRMQAARTALLQEIDEGLLRRYELLRDRKGGVAVALVVRGICEGCHVAIPEKRLAQLLDPETNRIFTCEGCGRILHAQAS